MIVLYLPVFADVCLCLFVFNCLFCVCVVFVCVSVVFGKCVCGVFVLVL